MATEYTRTTDSTIHYICNICKSSFDAYSSSEEDAAKKKAIACYNSHARLRNNGRIIKSEYPMNSRYPSRVKVSFDYDYTYTSKGEEITSHEIRDVWFDFGKICDDFQVSLLDFTCTYDGNAHYLEGTPTSTEKTGVTYSYCKTKTGSYVSDLSSLKWTDAGKYTVYVKAVHPDHSNPVITTANLIIKPRLVIFVGKSEERTYTGSDITLTGFSKITGLISGHTHNVTHTVKAKEVGKHAGKITEAKTVVIKNASGTNVTKNYDIRTIAGVLTIKENS